MSGQEGSPEKEWGRPSVKLPAQFLTPSVFPGLVRIVKRQGRGNREYIRKTYEIHALKANTLVSNRITGRLKKSLMN